MASSGAAAAAVAGHVPPSGRGQCSAGTVAPVVIKRPRWGWFANVSGQLNSQTSPAQYPQLIMSAATPLRVHHVERHHAGRYTATLQFDVIISFTRLLAAEACLSGGPADLSPLLLNSSKHHASTPLGERVGTLE